MSLSINLNGASVDLLDVAQMAILHDKTQKTDSFILDTFFPNKLSFPNKEGVHVGDLETSQPLAPFVTAQAQAKTIKTGGGIQANWIPAAYLKPSRPITPDTVYDAAVLATLRDAGAISRVGKMTDAEKLRLAQVSEFNYIRKSIRNRKILMATDVLTTGKTTYAGDDYPIIHVYFGRHTDLTFTPTTLWDDVNATPVTDIETIISRMIEHAGTTPSIIVSSSAVFNSVAKNDEFKERFVKPNGANSASPFKPMFAREDKAQFRGEIDGIQWWTYDAVHKLNGVSERFIDRTGFYMIADNQGFQCQCAIKNLDVLGQALEHHDYIVEQKDPSAIKLITESSPLIAPSLVNGVAGGTGFIS